MKTNTDVSVLDNQGLRRKAAIEIGDNGSFESGLLMDANAIEKLIEAKIAALIGGAGSSSDTLKEISDSIPTKVSQLNNDSGFVTSSDISSFITENDLYNYLVSQELIQPAEEPATEPEE